MENKIRLISLFIVLLFVCGCSQDNSMKQYVVTFNTDGGSLIDNQVVNVGGVVTKPDNPIKDGYLFSYWEVNGHAFDFSEVIWNDIELLAKWVEKIDDANYVVNFDTDGGNIIASKVVNDEFVFDTPTKDGYTFLGWYLDDVLINDISQINDSVVLVAKWEKKNLIHTVSFVNDNTVISLQTVNDNELVEEPILEEKLEYQFLGWYNNGVKWDFKTPINSDLTLVALWDDKSISDEEKLDKVKQKLQTIEINHGKSDLITNIDGCVVEWIDVSSIDNIVRKKQVTYSNLEVNVTCGDNTDSWIVIGKINASNYTYDIKLVDDNYIIYIYENNVLINKEAYIYSDDKTCNYSYKLSNNILDEEHKCLLDTDTLKLHFNDEQDLFYILSRKK
ncbi:MAG: InlB B-repeat-containing protein [bacterium]|nr:InlB B-repeat-containing protein [bacterium]